MYDKRLKPQAIESLFNNSPPSWNFETMKVDDMELLPLAHSLELFPFWCYMRHGDYSRWYCHWIVLWLPRVVDGILKSSYCMMIIPITNFSFVSIFVFLFLSSKNWVLDENQCSRPSPRDAAAYLDPPPTNPRQSLACRPVASPQKLQQRRTG